MPEREKVTGKGTALCRAFLFGMSHACFLPPGVASDAVAGSARLTSRTRIGTHARRKACNEAHQTEAHADQKNLRAVPLPAAKYA